MRERERRVLGRQACEICRHPQRGEIEEDLRQSRSIQYVADKWGVTNDVAGSHKHKHMLLHAVPVVLAGRNLREGVQKTGMDPESLFAEHDEVIREAKRLIDFSQGEYDLAEKKWVRLPDVRGWGFGVREWRGCLDQKNRMLGLYDRIDPRLQRSFASRVIEVVSHALEEFPDAKEKVLMAIEGVQGRGEDDG